MGCRSSRIDPLDFVRGRYPRTVAFLELTPYSRKLADLFAANDTNDDQKLAISEFLRALKVERTRAAIRLFSICDMDGSGALDFRELIFTIWHLCTVDVNGLSNVVFDIYDEDQNGRIDYEDLYKLLVDCYGKSHMEKKEITEILAKVEAKGGSMNRLQFAEFTKRSPQTLKQMIDIQHRVREDTLGKSVWVSLEKKRLKKTDPNFRSENWQDLFSRILILDIQARTEDAADDMRDEAQEASASVPAAHDIHHMDDIETGKKEHKKEFKVRANKLDKKAQRRAERDKAVAAAAAAAVVVPQYE